MSARLAVVTGGSRGIGRATARALLAGGHRVLITGRDASTLRQACADLSEAGQIEPMVLDGTDLDAIAAALAGVPADILVANVGIGFSGTVQGTSLTEWQRVLTANLTGTFVTARAVLPGMLERGWGRIVTVGSLASVHAIRYGAAYTASKHGLLGLTRAIAEDCRGKGVTANLVAPAFVRTDMARENVERMVAGGIDPAEAERRLAAMSSWGRLIEPEEVAERIRRLTTEEAAGTTGTVVTVGFDDDGDPAAVARTGAST